MQLLEIQEPFSPPVKSHKYDIAIGIDFGTTNSLVAFSKDKKPYVIDDVLVPSLIGHDMSIGESGVRSIKRLIGKSLAEIKASPTISEEIKRSAKEENGVIKILVGERYFSIAEAISLILRELKHRADHHLGTDVEKAIITVPAHFDDNMRNVIKHAAYIAGLEVLRLISEPTAAAYAYGFENGAEGKYLVYDLGGGTFDVSLLNMRMGVFQVLATGGDVALGGDDIDHALGEYLGNMAIAENVKKYLSEHDEYNIEGYKISRIKFEEIITPLLQKTIDITKQVVAGYEEQIKAIILVGGSTRLPLVKKMLASMRIPIHADLDPDRVVALGAALQAENLTTTKDNLIIDVVPLSLGMELMGGIVDRIIPRNTSIPTSITKEFTTYIDNQNAMKFNIVQGERELVKDCRSLAQFELKGIPNMKAGAARISVTFTIDADGLLSVSALEKNTGIKQDIEVRPSYGITEKDITGMLEEAYKNIESDHNAKLLIATRIEAEQEILSTQIAIKETPHLLTSEELLRITESLNGLDIACKNANRDEILEKLDNLRVITKEFIEKRMDFSVRQILKGKKV
jgi:molecular chaperone HscA